MNIVDALRDQSLLGALPAFANLTSWTRWLVFLAAVDGLPFSSLAGIVGEDEALAIFTEHTGLTTYDPPCAGYPESVCIVGCQSGKTRIAGARAAFEAMTTPAEDDGTDLYAILVAQDQRSSLRTLFRYAAAPFDVVPVLQSSVTARRAETLTLESGCVLAVYPCRPASIRGVRARVVILDELAFYRSTEGYPTDLEMLRAARSRVATTGGKVIVLSSPYQQAGALFELHRKHFGRANSTTLVWQASAPAMNPTLPADYLLRMEEDDPEAYRSEVLGQFRTGTSTLLDSEAIAQCVASGVRERAPSDPVVTSYVSFVDAASGSGADAFTVAIAHADGERVVLDALRVWKPPFNPSGVIAEACDLLTSYGLRACCGDRYAAGFVLEGFRGHGIEYTPSELDRSAIYLEALPLVNAGRAVLLDIPELLRELRGLERRRGTSGRDRVDHARGAHDDMANAAAGALVRAASNAQARRRLQPWEG